MRRVVVVVLAVLLVPTLAIVVATRIRGSGSPVRVPKYPPVPDAAFLDEVVPDADGKVHVCVEGNGEELGTRTLDIDYAHAPTWARQAAIAQASTDIRNEHNASLARRDFVQDSQEASAAYVKFCYDCGSGPNCCDWTCHGVWRSPPEENDPQYCPEYRFGSCLKLKWLCPPSNMAGCGFCDYVDPP